ncbi:MAG: CoA ester lyase [Hyphomicrobiales bacterium]|nr:CoA ester lyase [Hyphomicrobiales bacterium]PCJ94325.1 MAG: CoA ester lyase [Hyphomicrobiales bacterium]
MKSENRTRSVLYVPADNRRALDKIIASPDALGADAVIFDLEDAVAPQHKKSAREALRQVLQQKRPACQVLVRINALSSPWGTEDLLAAMAIAPDAIVLPKVDGPEQIDELLSAFEASDVPPHVRLWAMIESPLGILNVAAIAQRAQADDPRLQALLMGLNDLSLASGVPLLPGREAFLPWMMNCQIAARAYGLLAIDGVFTALDDEPLYDIECAQAVRLGFDGKSLIHPKQIATCNDAFMPSERAVLEARSIVRAFADPANQAKGVLRVDGKMVEHLHLRNAQRVLLQAGLTTACGENDS